jgi:hypothetical protein
MAQLRAATLGKLNLTLWFTDDILNSKSICLIFTGFKVRSCDPKAYCAGKG